MVRKSAPLMQAIVVEAPDLLKERVLNLLDGAAPLQLAVKQGNAKAVQALIDAGADMEAEDGQGLTALQVKLTHLSTLFVWSNSWTMQILRTFMLPSEASAECRG